MKKNVQRRNKHNKPKIEVCNAKEKNEIRLSQIP